LSGWIEELQAPLVDGVGEGVKSEARDFGSAVDEGGGELLELFEFRG